MNSFFFLHLLYIGLFFFSNNDNNNNNNNDNNNDNDKHLQLVELPFAYTLPYAPIGRNMVL